MKMFELFTAFALDAGILDKGLSETVRRTECLRDIADTAANIGKAMRAGFAAASERAAELAGDFVTAGGRMQASLADLAYDDSAALRWDACLTGAEEAVLPTDRTRELEGMQTIAKAASAASADNMRSGEDVRRVARELYLLTERRKRGAAYL